MKKWIFLLSMFIYFSNVLFADDTFSVNVKVKGTVTDSLTKETIPYSTIRILAEENPDAVLQALAADENGNFSFNLKKTGNYKLQVDYVGKKQLLHEFNIAEEKNVDLGKLEMSDDNLLQEVSVVVVKPLVKVDLDKITYNMEEDPESQTNNVLDMLRKVPLVTVDGEENISVKGSSNFKIYMNGKPSNMISNNPKAVLKSMPANTVKDIQVITDPGAKYDAEGVAGIINIVTQSNTSMGGYTATVDAGVDSHGAFYGGAYVMLKYGKLGFTGNYNYNNWRMPEAESSTFREDRNPAAVDKYLYQNEKRKYNGIGHYGSGEFSYEVDTLNLFNVGFSVYDGNQKNKSDPVITRMMNAADELRYKYSNAVLDGSYDYGGIDLNVDYQRTFSGVPDRLLTASYRYSHAPNNSNNENIVKRLDGDYLPEYIEEGHIRQNTDASVSEHTYQLDFTTPLANKKHTVEAGVKYIFRKNESNSYYARLQDDGAWDEDYLPWGQEKDILQFKNKNDIWAAYAGYSFKLNRWGLKTGLRYEYTDQDIEYPLKDERNFETSYSNLVPSLTATYKLNDMQNIRLGYNMRIYRPGIWQLNPYVNNSNPNLISVGNPDLDAVQAHSINLNYGYFNPKFNLNLSATYEFENNSIENMVYISEFDTDNWAKGTTISTYENIGKKRKMNVSAYFNWSPSLKLRIFSNLFGEYVSIKTNNGSGLENSGWAGRFFAGVQYNLPYNFWIHGFIGAGSPWISLQNKGTSFSFHSLQLRKSLLDDKLNIRLYANNLFKKDLKFKYVWDVPEYYQETIYINKMREVGVSVSFRFGEMKAQIKKAARGISNDDMMQQSSGGGGQVGGQQGSGGGQP